MNVAIWTHPWDVVEEGPEQVAERLTELGVTELTVATTCHSVQSLTPHNPERRTFFADASAYFQPDDEYGAIEPNVNETMGEADWLATIEDGLADAPVSLNGWSVPFHSSVLGRRHPDATMVSPHGDDLIWGLCPSNPAVQEYGEHLVEDLAGHTDFNRFEMELSDYQYGTGYGWHHQEFFARLGPLGEFLFGLCFCEHCRENASDAGVDVEAARSAARDGIDDVLEGRLAVETDVGGWLMEHTAVADYAEARTETLAALFDDYAAATGSTPFGYYLKYGGFNDERMDVEHSWKHGLDLGQLSDPVDQFTVLAYDSDPEAVRSDVRAARTLTGDDVAIHAGIHAGHPVVHDYETLESLVGAAVDAGAERLSFYGYGVLPNRNLDWIGRALRAHGIA
ncbi:hypothetical protein [Halosimplex sp. J119]